MEFYKSLVLASLAASIVACGGSDNPQEQPPSSETAIETKTVLVGDIEYTVPEYAFLNESFEYTHRVEGEKNTKSKTFYHISDMAPAECCELNDAITIPTYTQVLNVGPAITLPAGREHQIKLDINTDFLDDFADNIREITWSIPEAINKGVSSDNKMVTFLAPSLANIEKWHFQVQAKTEQGRVLEASKVVFIVPESDWVSVTHIDESPISRTAFRDNNTFYYGDVTGHNFSGQIHKQVKYIASLGLVYLVTEDNKLFEFYDTGELRDQQPSVDFGNIIELVTVFSARFSTLVINDQGTVFSSFEDYDVALENSKGTAPFLLGGSVYLDLAGNIKESPDTLLYTGVEQLSHVAYRTTEGEVQVLSPGYDYQLSVFEEYDDYTYVTSTHPGEYSNNPALLSPSFSQVDGLTYAIRLDGSLVSNSLLPPELVGVQHISAGEMTSALDTDGVVHRWAGGEIQFRDDVLSGRMPNPMNLTKQSFEKYQATLSD